MEKGNSILKILKLRVSVERDILLLFFRLFSLINLKIFCSDFHSFILCLNVSKYWKEVSPLDGVLLNVIPQPACDFKC